MIKSMTGFGRAEQSLDELKLTVEIKTLNSKFLDTQIKMPKAFSEKEIEIRNLLEKHLERGKITVNIEYLNKQSELQVRVINEELFKGYYRSLKSLAEELNDKNADIFRLALYLPDVISPEIDVEAYLQHWVNVESKILEAIRYCDEFRIEEGKKLAVELKNYIDKIRNHLGEVENLDPERINQIKIRIKSDLKDLIPDGEYDKHRFEQELLYYIEKLDISEEKVRLKSHLDYFDEELLSEKSNGKKLNFISQEIGREINTIGSKASYAPITKHVVWMKDNLEKIKEQLLNIV